MRDAMSLLYEKIWKEYTTPPKEFELSDVGTGVIGDRPGCYGFWRPSTYLRIGATLTLEKRLQEELAGKVTWQIPNSIGMKDVLIRVWYFKEGVEYDEEALRMRENYLHLQHEPLLDEYPVKDLFDPYNPPEDR